MAVRAKLRRASIGTGTRRVKEKFRKPTRTGDPSVSLSDSRPARVTQPTLRRFLAARIRQWLVPNHPPSFEEIASYYGAFSPEDRREVEARVRDDLKAMRVTDDQWRRHEELSARFRTTHPSTRLLPCQNLP